MPQFCIPVLDVVMGEDDVARKRVIGSRGRKKERREESGEREKDQNFC